MVPCTVSPRASGRRQVACGLEETDVVRGDAELRPLDSHLGAGGTTRAIEQPGRVDPPLSDGLVVLPDRVEILVDELVPALGRHPRARGVQAVVLSAKVRAMLDERYHVSFADIAKSYMPAMRHRILLNFEGQAEGIQNDDILGEVLDQTPTALTKELKA